MNGMTGHTTPPPTPRPYNPAQAPLAPVRQPLVAQPVAQPVVNAAGGVNAFFQERLIRIQVETGQIAPLGPQ